MKKNDNGGYKEIKLDKNGAKALYNGLNAGMIKKSGSSKNKGGSKK